MRGRIFNLGKVGRLAGALALAAAMIATMVHFRHGSGRSAHVSVAGAPGDPIALEIAHCRAIGVAAASDAACEAAWAENRRRFFQYAPDHKAPALAANRSAAPAAERD
jgi:conjugative transfer region protein TrbK